MQHCYKKHPNGCFRLKTEDGSLSFLYLFLKIFVKLGIKQTVVSNSPLSYVIILVDKSIDL